MHGISKLITSILYGGGLRLNECLNMRVLDVDFENRIITVRKGKGDKDRTTVLPASIIPELKEHLFYIFLKAWLYHHFPVKWIRNTFSSREV